MPCVVPLVLTGRKKRWVTRPTTVENGGLFSNDPYRDRQIGSNFGMTHMPIGRVNPVALTKRMKSVIYCPKYSNEICSSPCRRCDPPRPLAPA